ncbi:MAG TPA: type II toxin-antitoxin system RelE/ParE family toxin [Candidatus Nanoarchaeia archaeon]|nr:type II toxin-antitoxin system RelE/ParE family toxin [Candidatus Nanoarchaeia archaeon]
MYSVQFDPKAIDVLKKLPKDIHKRIYDKIISTKENPLRYFERLTGRPDYKLRVGDYRVIADISMERHNVQITFIGHRKNVYE